METPVLPPSSSLAGLYLEYLLFVFVAACGVIQGAAAYSRLRGLLFLKRPSLSYLLSGVMIVGAFVWFFLWGDRSQPGLEGAQQLYLFTLGALAALVFTLGLSSLLRAGDFASRGPEDRPGLDALRERSYSQALRTGLERARKEGWLRWIKGFFNS